MATAGPWRTARGSAREIARAVRDAVGDRIAILAKLNLDDGVRRGLHLDDSIQVAQWLEADGSIDALEMTAGSSLLNPMYLFKGPAPLREFAGAMRQPVRLGIQLFGRTRLHSYPYRDGYLLEDATQGPRVGRAPDDPARWRDLARGDGRGPCCRLRVRRDGTGAVARAGPDQPATDRANARVEVHPLQQVHADQLRRDALSGHPRRQLALVDLGDGRRVESPVSVQVPRMEYRARPRHRRGAIDDGVYDAELDPGWVVGGGVNGGYVLAVVGNALRAELTDVGQPDPLSVSAYFLTPSRPGPARVRLRKVRVGGRRTTVAASLVQDEDGFEVERVSLLGVCGSLGEPGEVERQIPPPDLPPVEECLDASDASAEFLRAAPLLQRFGTRFDPEHAGWRTGRPSGQGVVQGWFKLADDRPLDPVALLLVVDAPAARDLRPGPAGVGADARAHRPRAGEAGSRVGDRAAGHPQRLRRSVRGGLRGVGLHRPMVAQSRQLALLPR